MILEGTQFSPEQDLRREPVGLHIAVTGGRRRPAAVNVHCHQGWGVGGPGPVPVRRAQVSRGDSQTR